MTMAEYIDRSALLNEYNLECRTAQERYIALVKAPAADVVEVEMLEAWLYEVAFNNVGCRVGDFATACEEIISRLGGLRVFVSEWRSGR